MGRRPLASGAGLIEAGLVNGAALVNGAGSVNEPIQ